MENQEQLIKPRVLKVDSEESWKLVLAEANAQGCPVIAQFMASWCIPSIAMNPFFEGLAQRYQNILFLMVDVDAAKNLAKTMRVTAMPSFLLMSDGVVVDKIVGANPEELRNKIDELIQSSGRPSGLDNI